jgi:hypothetical protein
MGWAPLLARASIIRIEVGRSISLRFPIALSHIYLVSEALLGGNLGEVGERGVQLCLFIGMVGEHP